MTQELGRGPADDELAVALGVTEDDIREARQAELAFSAYSLDAPLSGHEEDTAMLADVLARLVVLAEHVSEHRGVPLVTGPRLIQRGGAEGQLGLPRLADSVLVDPHAAGQL